nr:FAD-dependent oxidoreductase [Micromonospora sp. DSM 115978]
MDRPDLDVLVVGAGVSGLTTAVLLAEDGFQVGIWTAEPPQSTTSVAAGAMWGPYLVEHVGRVAVWSGRTLVVLRQLAMLPETGVRLVSGIEAARTPVEPPDWGRQLDSFRLCTRAELPAGFEVGWRFTAPLVDMPTYLSYLEKRFVSAGGTIELRRISALPEAAAVAPIVVNCAGIGAYDLVPDSDLTPIRGQLVVVENPGITEFFSEDTGDSPDLVHFYPHIDTVVLGGSAQHGVWSREPDPAVAARIIARCAAIEPRLRDARVIDHRVGLRPACPRPRVDAEVIDGLTVISNYGHGGAGVTLSWGCAVDVVAEVRVAR